MYCSTEDVKKVLPPSVTIGNLNIGVPSPSPATTGVRRDKLTPAEVIQYIRFAQQEVDSRLRPFYSCPLRRVKEFETDILNNANSGTSINIEVWDSNAFATGDTVRLQSKNEMELALISNVPDERNVTISILVNSYLEGSKISVVTFPDPVPLITAHLAVSYAFDQLFNAQQAPDISNYGIEQRKLALNSMDNILDGTILLFGQEHTGRRFVRSTLMDTWNTPADKFQFGREK